MRLPDGLGLETAAAHPAGPAQRALRRDDGLRLGRERGRGAQGRRLRLPDQAGRPQAVPRRGGLRRAGSQAAPQRATRAGRRGSAPARSARPAAAGAGARCERLVGESEPMRLVKARIAKVARGMAPVLVRGESGTGKELVARAVHACSQRSDGPFVAVNCGAIPENLLEAEFFGARKGSYTGSSQDRDGYFQAARGGTLFLDEIGDLPLADAVQAAARDPGAQRAPDRLDAGRRGRRAHRERHPQGPAGRGAGRPLPPGPVLPPQRDRDRGAGRCASAAKTCPRCAHALLARIAHDAGHAGADAVGRRAAAAVASIRCTATCASSRTCCTAPWR